MGNTFRWKALGSRALGFVRRLIITVAEIIELVRGEYDAPPETVERDVMELLNDLADEKLLDEDSSPAAAV